MPSYMLSPEEQRQFIDSFEETCTRLSSLKKDELRSTIARMVDVLSLAPSTIIPDLYNKMLECGLGQREASIAFAILIAGSLTKETADKILSSNGIDAIIIESERYQEYYQQ